ncbi:MAG: GNAT family N-acetyltransferase [Candidatus Hodarchaeales archaeon]
MKNHKIHVDLAKPENARQIANLELEAFEGKISWMLQSSIDVLLPFIEKYYRTILSNENRTVFIAKQNDDSLIALLILKAENLKSSDAFFPFSDFLQVLQKLSVRMLLRLIIGFLLLNSSPPSNNLLLIETLAVKKDKRGHGVGSLLLELTEKIARKKRYTGIVLYVALNNIKAIKLYLRKGFQPIKVLKSHFFYTFLGVKGFILMIKKFEPNSSH